MKGSPIPPPVSDAIRLYSVCSAFEFKHLPMAGGIYDQHPDILDRFTYILAAQEEQREREEAERKRRQGGPRPRGGKMSSRPTY